jgi:hypothetical protein
MDLRVDTQPQNYMDFFVLIVEAPNISWYEVALAVQPAAVVMKESRFETDGGIPNQQTVVQWGVAKLTQWNHVTLDVDFNATQAIASLEGTQATLALKYAPTFAAVTAFSIHIGIGYDAPMDTGTVRHDNVVCDVTP